MSAKERLKPVLSRIKNGRDRYQAMVLREEADWRSFPIRLSRLRISRMASSISYYLVFAMFPLILLIFSAVAVFGDELIRTVSQSIDLKDFIPQPIIDFITLIYEQARGSNTISAVSVSIISLLWAASKGINAIVISMRQIYHTDEKRPLFIVTRFISVILTIVVMLFIVSIMIVLAFSEAVLSRLVHWTGIVIENRYWIRTGSFITGYAILLLTFWLIYYFSAARRTKGRHALLAASVVALAWVLTSYIFSLYVSRSTSINVYGGMTGIVILLLWLYVCTYALLLGAAFHAMLRDRYRLKQDLSNESEEKNGQNHEAYHDAD